MRSENLKIIRNKLIFERYAQLWGRGLRDEVIMPDLSKEFFLSEKTLRDIIRNIRKAA